MAGCCVLLEVSRSAYYDWSKHRPSRRQLADAELMKRFDDSSRLLGGPTAGPGYMRPYAELPLHARGNWARLMRPSRFVLASSTERADNCVSPTCGTGQGP